MNIHYLMACAAAADRAAAARRCQSVRDRCAKVAARVRGMVDAVEYTAAMHGHGAVRDGVALAAWDASPVGTLEVVDLAGAVLWTLGNEPVESLREWDREDRMELAAAALGLGAYEAANILDPVPIDEHAVPWGRCDFDTPCQPAEHIMPDDFAAALDSLAAGGVAADAWR